MSSKTVIKKEGGGDDEFLWLMSLSDLMILLFIFFVLLFSFAAKRMKQQDFMKVAAGLRNEEYSNPIDDVKKKLDQWVKELKLEEAVAVTGNEDEVVVEIRDKLLFGSGQWEPHEQGKHIISVLAKILEKIPKPLQIGIEGHTDDSPMHTDKIEDNWDLAAKRATSMLRTLDLSLPVLIRTVVMSYGEMRPIHPNRDLAGRPDPAAQSKNRRVTIRIF